MAPQQPRSLEFQPNRAGLVAPVRIDPAGRSGPTPGQANGPRWRRSSYGLYVPAAVDATRVEQRILEAAAVLPSYGGVTGWAALRWCGASWFSGLTLGGRAALAVWLATGPCDVRRQGGIEISAERLDPSDLMTLDGLRITTPVRSTCFEMRYVGDVRRAVVAADMAAYSDVVSLDELNGYAAAHRGWTGIPQCREALTLASENSWSPRETLMRLIWEVDAGLGRPLCNVPVFDRAGRHLGTPDLLDPEVGVVGEYDGADHLTGPQRHKDVSREGVFRAAGLECAAMLAADWRDPGGFIRRLRQAYDRAGRTPPSRRLWTLERPDWWIDTSTVARRRSLTFAQRRVMLRYRAW